MKEGERLFKKFFILVVFIFGLLIVSAALYFIFKEKPSCQDGILNQNEERTDCGGPCLPCPERLEVQDLETVSVEWSVDSAKKIEILGKIINPNLLVGLEKFDFRFVLRDEAGEEIFSTDWQAGFILPKENKGILALGIASEKIPAKIDLEFNKESFVWKKFSQYDEPDLFVINPRFERVSDGGTYQVVGTLFNKSTVDFETIRVKVYLRDAQNILLGVNYQVVNTVRAGEQRDFLVFFPQTDSSRVVKVEVEPETNVFSSDNYIRIFGRPERWDE